MARPKSIAIKVGESNVYPLRDSLLKYILRRRKKKPSDRKEKLELFVNCLEDREDFVEKTDLY